MAKSRPMKLLVPLALFGLAFLVRVLPWPQVLHADRIYFHGNDAYYHMRRVLYALESGRLLDFDPYINFPEGARAIWPPLFDALLAFVLLPFYWLGGESALERAAVFVPPAIGSATVVALYFVARRHYGAAIGAGAAFVLSVLSAHFWYSQIGFIDHHAAVAALALLLFAATLELLRSASGPGVPKPGVRAASLFVGLCLGAMLLLWPGGLLYVGLCEVCMITFLLTRDDPDEATRFALAFGALHAVALLCVLLPGIPQPWPQWSRLSPVVLTWFQPWLFAGASITGFACAALWRRTSSGAGPRSRALSAGAIVVVVVAVSLVAIPGLLGSASDAWQWLAKREVFQASVRESEALFFLGGAFSVEIAEIRLSRFIYLFPFALLALGLEARDPEKRLPSLVLLTWALPLALVTVVQRRFFNTFSIFLALVLAWSAVRLYRALVARLGDRRGVRVGVAASLCGLAIFALEPLRHAYAPHVSALRDSSTERRPHQWSPLLETAAWLRANTPQTPGYFDAALRPDYGIMASAGNGHVIEYIAQRATTTSNFGDDLGLKNYGRHIAYFTAADEATGSRILDESKLRFVVSQPTIKGDSAIMPWLFNRDGSGMGRHRMVYESSRVTQSNGPRALKVFEHVAGALLVGCAPPGEAVRVRLVYSTNRGRRAVWEARTVASDEGEYRVRVPHSNSERPEGSVETAAGYSVAVTGEQATVAVAENQVLAGAELAAPSFPLGEAANSTGCPVPQAPAGA